MSEISGILNSRERNFNAYVREQAIDLLKEIKRNVSSYGEIRKELRKRESSSKWECPHSHFHVVVKEAKWLFEKEIDATTIV